MKIALITTVNHNIGDDFVREGIKFLLRQTLKGLTLEFQNIHKHAPITARYGFEWFRDNRISSRVDPFIPLSWTRDKIREADLVVQCGAPVYWCHESGDRHCHGNEWYGPLMARRFVPRKETKTFINLAAGTIQPYYWKDNCFCRACQEYIKKLHGLARVTTFRDRLSQKILAGMGLDAPVIACSSIFCPDEYGLKPLPGEYVVMNYMHGASHYLLEQSIDIRGWEKTFVKFHTALSKQEKIVVACHNLKEVREAKKLNPRMNIFYRPGDYLAYVKLYQKAKLAIVNRIHSAFLVAAFGRPAMIIGNDTRARMGRQIGLRHFFVNQVDQDLLMDNYVEMKKQAPDYAQTFWQIKQEAFDAYQEALAPICG